MIPVVWVGRSREEVRQLPPRVRHRLGYEVFKLQMGETPGDSRAMPSVGPGVWEVRVRERGAYRLLYIVDGSTAVYVLHAFEKKSRATPRRSIHVARARLREIP